MAKLKRVKVIIRDEEFNLTPRQLINKLSKLDHWDYEDFFENNPTDNFNHFGCKEELIDQILEDYETAKMTDYERRIDNMMYFRQEERTSLDAPIYPHGWYEKQDNEIIFGKEKK
tara:strand:+ start:176 stop:520 length:345 start_codon:yes stop_codon:yes gene_type:complete